MGEEKLAELVKERSKDGKLPCKEAFNIAEEEGCSPQKVGETCNQLEIKIVSCQLGCF